MWDHMALLRGAFQKKIIPPICRVKSIAQMLAEGFWESNHKRKDYTTRQATKGAIVKGFCPGAEIRRGDARLGAVPAGDLQRTGER